MAQVKERELLMSGDKRNVFESRHSSIHNNQSSICENKTLNIVLAN